MTTTTEVKNILAARKIPIFLLVSILLLMAVFAGCGPDRSGTPFENQKPIVYIANTPPDGARFSRNPDLNWYATDIDGFISFFRYAVVVESLLTINGQQVSVEDFADQATDDQFGWTVLEVDLDHPQSTATVRLYANVDFPVDSFVNQYFFIQAADNLGALSDMKWRRYSRNNHYPNTHHRGSRVYINAKNDESPAPGIQVTWSGADSTDWGRAIPPLEFEWRLYGPFLDTAKIFVNIAKENCRWDPDADSFTNCIDVQVLDLDALPPAVGDLPQPLMHSKGPGYDTDSTDVWVTDEEATIYDVFKDLESLTKTTQFKFIFWVRARDDGFVPDPSPAFSQFLVLEALFERDVAVSDETYYARRAGRWHPDSVQLVKGIFQNYINTALDDIHSGDYIPFDTFTRFDYVVEQGGYPPDVTTDFFSITPTPYWNYPGSPQWGSVRPNRVDLLSHKVHIFFNDDATGGPDENPTSGLLSHVYFAMDMGSSGWFMGRNLANGNQSREPGTEELSADFAEHFGMTHIYHEGWFWASMGRIVCPEHLPPIWNQQFIGCYSLVPEIFPDIDINIDYLTDRYIKLDKDKFTQQSPFVDTLFLDAMPEVGAGTRSSNATAVYLYRSKHGTLSLLNGQVMGVAQSIGDMRSVAVTFTPIATDSVQTQQMFTSVLIWLTDKWLSAQGAAKVTPGIFAKGSAPNNLAERRQRIRDYFERVEQEAQQHPELLQQLGIVIDPPVVRYKD
jgi:hypothetical protein